MIYRISEQDAQTLIKKPETGMGYQKISALRYHEYDLKNYIVYNSNLEGYSAILNMSSEIMLETNSIKVFNQESIKENKSVSFEKMRNNKRRTGNKGALDNPIENATGDEFFVRISAYADDKRIDFINKKLKPGSFTTTFYDYRDCVSTYDDPIDRYALPNDEKINFAFFIKPRSFDKLQRGIVQPAFDHEGGGIEAYFDSGTFDNTFLDMKKYGEY